MAHLVRMSLILAFQRRRKEKSQLKFSIRTVENNVYNLQLEESISPISLKIWEVVLVMATTSHNNQ